MRKPDAGRKRTAWPSTMIEARLSKGDDNSLRFITFCMTSKEDRGAFNLQDQKEFDSNVPSV